jgi:putative DNA primase/helicase
VGRFDAPPVRFNHIQPERLQPFQKVNSMANSNGTKPSPVTQLVHLIEGVAELFRDQRGRPHCTLGWHTFLLDPKSTDCVARLRKHYKLGSGGFIRLKETTAAIEILQMKALDGSVHEVFVRIGKYPRGIVLDLGRDDGKVIEVRPDGWSVLAAPPVKFRRPEGLQAIPPPSSVRGTLRQELAPLIERLPPADQVLIMAWLLSAMNAGVPQPLLELIALQGSAKSSLTKGLRSCLDPSFVPTRTLPHTDRDLFIAAHNNGILAFDNVSSISDSLSDALCQIATGGGFATRKNYTDDEEALFYVCRPVILNGIHEVITRPDLRDRTISIVLPAIEPADRIPDSEWQARISTAQPRILAALLDVTAAALRLQDSVKPATLPRMADSYRFALAAAHDAKFGFAPAEFEAAYQANRESAVDLAIDSSIIARPILDQIAMVRIWSGTMSDLLTDLPLRVDEAVLKSPQWPRSPEALSRQFSRIEADLKARGVEIVRSRDPVTRARKLVMRQKP